MTELVTIEKAMTTYDRGRNELISYCEIDDVKKVRDKAEALRRYWVQRKDKMMEAACSAIRLRAEYEIGVRSKALEKDVTGKTMSRRGTSLDGKRAVLKKAGIPFQRAIENERLAELLTEKEIDAVCKDAVTKGKTAKTARGYLFQWKCDEDKIKFKAIKSDIPSNLHIGDFRKTANVLADSSVDLVFIDPPYDRESITLYEAAAVEAARILKDGGSMVSYCGHGIVPDVLNLMSKYLNYFWIGAHVHDGGPMSRMSDFGIIVGFKPLLWFIKGKKRANRQSLIKDTVLVNQEKSHHPWQQAIAVAENFINGLSMEGGTVVDFFAGSGTTLIAAKNLKRMWHGFEVDEKAALMIMDRMK